MPGTVISTKDDSDEEKEILENDMNKKTDWDGDLEDKADDEVSNKDEELLKTRLFIDASRDLIIYEGAHSASLTSIHRVHFASTGDDVSTDLTTRPKKPLVCYDWLVLIFSFCAVMICTGIIGSMSVFYVEFLNEFSSSKAEAALVPSLANGMYDIGGILAGLMVDTIGIRKSMYVGGLLTAIPCAISYLSSSMMTIIFLLGICCAFGSSVVMIAGMVRIGQQFGHDHPIGTVIISGSHPAGFIIFPLMMPLLIELYCWRGAILILSAITLNIIPLGILATTGMEKEIEVETEGPVEKSCIKRLLKKCPLDFALIKNAKFQLFALTTAINWGSIFLVHLLIVDFAEDRGFTLAEGAGLLTLLGIAALVSRFLVALLKMIKSVKNIIWYIGFALIASFMHACIPLTNSYRSLLVTVGLLGIVFGCRFSFFVLSLLEMVPVQKYPQALGYCLSLWGLAVMITGPIVGQVTTLKGSYDFSYIMGGMVAACSLIPLTVYVIRNKGQFNFYNKQNSDSN